MKGKIIVITHKDYQMPNSKIYFPICVGSSAERLCNKFQPDDVGDNISKKNSTYCELTGIYWAYKNLNEDFIGVAHYRRYFTLKNKAKDLNDVISKEQIEEILAKKDVIVTPAKRYITTIKSHYINSQKSYKEIHKKDIENLIESVRLLEPNYSNDLDVVLNSKSAHMLNMFIMKKNLFNDYCKWLFRIIDKTVELSQERKDQSRYAGALSEFLLDVYLKHNKLSIYEAKLIETEQQHIFKKIFFVLKKKWLKK